MDLTPSVATVQERWAGCPDKYRTYRLNISKLLFLCFTLICVPFGIAQTEPFDQPDSERYDKSSPLQSRMHDFDIRLSSPRDMKSTDDTVLILARTERHDAIVMAFQQRFGAEDGLLRLSLNADGMVVSLSRQHDFLSGPVEGNPVEVAKSFLAAHGDLFRLNASEINGLRLIRQEAKQNLVYLRFYQTLNDVDVFEGQVRVVLSQDGRVAEVGLSSAAPGLIVGNSASHTPESAVITLFRIMELPPPSHLLVRDTTANGRVSFQNPLGDHLTPIVAELCVFPLRPGSGVYAYRIQLEIDSTNWYEIVMDAENGRILLVHNLYRTAAAGRVWKESPVKGGRELVNFSAAWLPSGGQVTTGNNVDAYLDRNGNNIPDATVSSTMSAGRAKSTQQLFDFSFGDRTTLQDPTNFPAAAVTNLFYFVNEAHDYFYQLGFDEAAGNFQSSNFGRGGIEGDPVLAQAQDGSYDNNVSISTTPDGVSPRIHAGLFKYGLTDSTWWTDSDYDGAALFHEYSHGVTTRMVGGGKDTSCLMGTQSGALAEGWSDYFAASRFNNPVLSPYLSLDDYHGIRRNSYERYPYTYEDLGNHGFESHNDGEIWAAALWDLRKNLGQSVVDRLVFEGLRYTPCHPTMPAAREAILTADDRLNQGANRAAIWRVFTNHGLGASASGYDGDWRNTMVFTASYDLPSNLASGNRPPSVKSNAIPSAAMGRTFTYQIEAQDPEGGTLHYELIQGPAGMTVDRRSGVVSWPASFLDEGVRIAVSDSQGGSVVHGFALHVETPINPGMPLKVSGTEGTIGYATVNVPDGTRVLQVTLRPGNGDPSLIVIDPDMKQGIISRRVGAGETVSVPTPKSGTWLVNVLGYRNYWDVSMNAELPLPMQLQSPQTLNNLSGDYTSETFYKVTVPAGLPFLKISTRGGTGDVDLYARRGAPATVLYYDSRSIQYGNVESITINLPSAGDYFFTLYGTGKQGYSNITLSLEGGTPSATITVTPSSCTIPIGSDRCSVTYQVTNPNRQSVQVWVKGPSDPQDQAITGTFTNTSFTGTFDWVREGTTTFSLYEITASERWLLASATVIAKRQGTSPSITVTPSCTIPATGTRCSVTYQVTNPNRKSVQVWVKGPSDAQDKAITGTFTDPSFTGTFDWIFQGTTTFNLYDVGVNPKQLLASATAIGNK